MEEQDPEVDSALAQLRRQRTLWTEIPTEETDLYGNIYAPRSLDQLMLVCGQFAFVDDVAWRGQADAAWKLDPSLVRRWRSQRGFMGPAYPLDEARLRQHERDVIEQTREAGFSEPRDELELLAKIQHHGGATRLLDCTRNAFVALWFASKELADRDGVLVGFRLGGDRAMKLDTAQLGKDIDELLLDANGRLIWWQPRQANPRIAAQQALFVFSEHAESNWGSVKLTGEPEMTGIGNVPGLIALLVSKDLKSELASTWQPLFGFSDAALFPDFDGFAASQGVDKPFRLGAPI